VADPDGVIVVAGAAGGIGRAVVADCLARSATVAALVHHPSADPVNSVPEFAVDITDRVAVFAAIDRVVEEVGSIAGLVNTSAVQDLGRLDELSEADWNSMISVNLTGAHHLTQAVAASMAAAGLESGSIVHIASIEGHRPAPAHGHYGASKAALISYARSAAAELGPVGVRVNSISPGLCHRAGLEADWPDGVERWRTTAPLGRLVTADEVARVCWFLLSDQSAAVTGADLIVDAGVMATAGW
jgi:NAD(P)-dependent dehydrogenase (short-subunit alcohol dehydrogenase family)